jgi:hypothetical protein
MNIHTAPRDRPLLPARKRDRWILGVDLGQSNDYTAICGLHHTVTPLDTWTPWHGSMKQARVERFDVMALARRPLGEPYPEQVRYVKALLEREPFKGAQLVVDETGVGRPVADIFVANGLKPNRIAIGSGLEVNQRNGYSFTVPKLLLVSTLEAKMHTGQFKIAPEIAGELQEELREFQRKVSESGRSTYDARSGAHDDLILSCAIALWWATSETISSVRPLHL